MVRNTENIDISQNKVFIWSANADMFTSEKLLELKKRIIHTKDKPHIIAILEAKPKNCSRDLTKEEFQLPCYGMEEINLFTKKGRGIIVYISETIKYNTIDILPVFEEAFFLSINCLNEASVVIGFVYRSPNCDHENDLLLNQLITNGAQLYHSDIFILIGDFNFPKIDWTSLSSPGDTNSREFVFLETLRDSFLSQMIQEPTRARGTNNPSILDLIITNSEDAIAQVNLEAPLGKSDHVIMQVQVTAHPNTDLRERTFLNYDRGNYTALRTFMDRNWESEMRSYTTVEDKWNYFRSKYEEAVNLYIPRKKIIRKKMYKFPLSQATRKKIKDKNKLWKQYLTSRRDEDYLKYKRTRNQVRRATRKEEKEHEKRIVENIKRNPKKFWCYARQKTRIKTGIGELKKEDGSATKTEAEKALVLGDFFSRVFTANPSDDLNTSRRTINEIHDCTITIDIVINKLRNLKICKSPGPDQVHPRVIKEAYMVVAPALVIIFKQSIIESKLPLDWKNAHISAIFKKGRKDLATNYRPVSLTSIIVKLLESILRDELMEHMQVNQLFSERQYGFIPGRSTILQLLTVVDKWMQGLDSGEVIDVLYFDFMKAFDRVPHRYLLQKLRTYGVTGRLHAWVEQFLSNRKQRTKVGTDFSPWYPVTSGIPQGSVLGPFLFVVFINDLPDVIENSEIYLFADDVKLFRVTTRKEECALLQEDVDRVAQWSSTSKLKIHPDKCKHMHISSRSHTPLSRYTVETRQIDLSGMEKDLGVSIDSHLTFDSHINNKISKANSILGVICRTFTYRDKDIMLQLYKSLVRPHLEYANQLWAPYLVKHTTAIENVQRRMTRMIPGMSGLDYEERLRSLELPTLAYRRLRGDLIETYKIITGHYTRSITHNLFQLSDISTTRGHHLKITKQRSRTTKCQNSFFFRVVDSWNALPDHVVNSPTIKSFESRLDIHLRNHDIKYDFRARPSLRRYVNRV